MGRSRTVAEMSYCIISSNLPTRQPRNFTSNCPAITAAQPYHKQLPSQSTSYCPAIPQAVKSSCPYSLHDIVLSPHNSIVSYEGPCLDAHVQHSHAMLKYCLTTQNINEESQAHTKYVPQDPNQKNHCPQTYGVTSSTASDSSTAASARKQEDVHVQVKLCKQPFVGAVHNLFSTENLSYETALESHVEA